MLENLGVAALTNILNPKYSGNGSKPLKKVVSPVTQADDSESTNGEFLSRTFESRELWRYGETFVSAKGAILQFGVEGEES